jgi:acetyl esterase/lipase
VTGDISFCQPELDGATTGHYHGGVFQKVTMIHLSLKHNPTAAGASSRNSILFSIFLAMMTLQGHGQSGPALSLWEEAAPGALGTESHDIPTITPYLAADPDAKDSGGVTTVVVFPGGGYGGLAAHEGHDYALWLNQQGMHAFVVKYRLGSHGYRHPVMLGDAARAVRLVRFHASRWNVNPARIGVIGSSAGGHLVSTLATHFDHGDSGADDPVERMSSRPDFAILCYPVITMGPGTHNGSRRNLLGDNPDPALVWELSNEKQVTPQTPPCFIWHTAEDGGVRVQNAIHFASALADAGVPFDLHVFQKGRHGIGLQDKPPFANTHPWSADLLFWLRENGWL